MKVRIEGWIWTAVTALALLTACQADPQADTTPAQAACKTAADCEDGNACTVDLCNSSGNCAHPTKSCDDGDACTQDSCAADTGCKTKALACDDGVDCTADSCDAATGCKSIAKNDACDDGDACTNETCDKTTGCATSAKNCSDGNECTNDACAPESGCTHSDKLCEDGIACTADKCDSASGCVFVPQSSTCDDGVACTKDDCILDTGCVAVANAAACDDGNPCTTETCDTAKGCQIAPKDCDDGDKCTDDACSKVKGCVNTTVTCEDDGVACTVDQCQGGACSSVPSAAACDDGDACTTEVCDKLKGCQFAPKDCNDGDACTEDSCAKVSGCVNAKKDCADGNECTSDNCDKTGSCTHSAAVGAKCSIGTCDEAAKCIPCEPKCVSGSCSDGCGGACQGSCSDGNACTDKDACNNGKCQGIGKNCEDGNSCTSDNCESSAGCVHTPNLSATCSDGDVCTTNDKCSAGKCAGTGKALCDDANPCTIDTCKPGTGCANTPAPEKSPCGGIGVCIAGNCCSCPAGQYCNASGTCVSTTSCQGKCGQYDDASTCQCDSECTKYGDCCKDFSTVCSTCKPSAFANCCDGGKALCYFDSCGKEEVAKKETCGYGCEPAAPGQMFDMCKGDPCGGVSGSGECLSKSMIAYCAVNTGDGAPPKLDFFSCEPWEECDESYGFAWCKPSATACQPGAQQCVPGQPNKAKVCVDGAWVEESCAGCAPTSVGATVACPGNIALASATAKVTFEYVVPKPGYTGYNLDNTYDVPVIFASAFSVRYASDFSTATVLDFAVTNDQGSLTIKVPQQPNTATDFVLLFSAAWDDTAKKFRYVVAKPELGDGEAEVHYDMALTGNAHLWALGSGNFKSTGAWQISLADGGWALQVYDAVRYSLQNSVNVFGGNGKTMVVWVREGTDWSCGACFAPWPTTSPVNGLKAQSQMWIGTSDLSFLSNAVLYHEVGHWAMSSFGTSPNEGGTHFLGTKVPPGMAWSEGWATFYSSMARGNSVYYDQGGNGMFWMDLSKAKYSDAKALLPFNASGSLTQFMDENRVAAALWNSAVQSQEPLKEPGNQGFWKALTSKQMNSEPFTRPYNRQTWTSVTPGGGGDLNATYVGLKSTNTPAPTFAAYLDALLCAAPQLKSAVATAIAPLPFPVNTPICKP